jgi:hypothetical protein
VAPRTQAADLQKLPLPEARERLDDLYRLPPDRRFIAVVAAARRILRGGGPPTVQLTFASGQWTIACDGQEVGTLPEFPTYADARGILKAWTAKLGAEATTKKADTPPDSAMQPFSPADLVSTHFHRWRWNPSAPDGELRAPPAGLTLMFLQSFDWLEQTNDIAGQAAARYVANEERPCKRASSAGRRGLLFRGP